MLSSIIVSNRAHAGWPQQALERLLGDLRGVPIAVWGLTYKAGTDTLRRSASLDLCRELTARGARVQAFDPAVRELPASDRGVALLAGSPVEAAAGARALVVMTPWPEFGDVAPDDVVTAMGDAVVLDPAGVVAARLGCDARIRYVTVGVST